MQDTKSSFIWENGSKKLTKSDSNTIQPEVRRLLLKWVMKMCEDLELQRQTYHLAVSYLDKFCAEKFEKIPLKLIAGGCILIAAKQEVLFILTLGSFSSTLH